MGRLRRFAAERGRGAIESIPGAGTGTVTYQGADRGRETNMSATETVSPMAVARTIFERLNDHDAEGLIEFLAEDVIQDWPTVGRLEGKVLGSSPSSGRHLHSRLHPDGLGGRRRISAPGAGPSAGLSLDGVLYPRHE